MLATGHGDTGRFEIDAAVLSSLLDASGKAPGTLSSQLENEHESRKHSLAEAEVPSSRCPGVRADRTDSQADL